MNSRIVCFNGMQQYILYAMKSKAYRKPPYPEMTHGSITFRKTYFTQKIHRGPYAAPGFAKTFCSSLVIFGFRPSFYTENRVPSIRENQGKSGRNLFFWKVREFVPFRENQGIIFCLYLMVRESQGICSDSAQTLCNFHCSVSKYAYHEKKKFPSFSAPRDARDISLYNIQNKIILNILTE